MRDGEKKGGDVHLTDDAGSGTVLSGEFIVSETTFNNVSPAGARPGLFKVTSDTPTIEEHDTVDTKVADALLMALL